MVNFYFLDSSALVKRYVPETGSAWVQSIANTSVGNLIAIAQITWVEVLSALSHRRREETLSDYELDIISQKFRNEFKNQYRVIKINQRLLEKAGELVLQYPRRAYDAI